MAKKTASRRPSADLSSVKAAKAWAKDVEGTYAEELKDRESARAFLRKKGYLTATGRLTAQYSR